VTKKKEAGSKRSRQGRVSAVARRRGSPAEKRDKEYFELRHAGLKTRDCHGQFGRRPRRDFRA